MLGLPLEKQERAFTIGIDLNGSIVPVWRTQSWTLWPFVSSLRIWSLLCIVRFCFGREKPPRNFHHKTSSAKHQLTSLLSILSSQNHKYAYVIVWKVDLNILVWMGKGGSVNQKNKSIKSILHKLKCMSRIRAAPFWKALLVHIRAIIFCQGEVLHPENLKLNSLPSNRG